MFKTLSVEEVAIIYSIINYSIEQKHNLDQQCFEIVSPNLREHYSINDLLKIINN